MVSLSLKIHDPEESRYSYYNTRTLYLLDDTLQDDGCACGFMQKLLELDNRNHELPITIVVKSGGGDISDMFPIVEVMRTIAAPVYTQVIGEVASAATMVSACGKKGYRYMLPSAMIMIHEPWTTGMGGDARQLEIEQRVFNHNRDMCIQLLSDATGKTDRAALAKLKRDISRDKWFTADEAIDYGLVDAIGFAPTLLNWNIPKTSECCGSSNTAYNVDCEKEPCEMMSTSCGHIGSRL